MSKAIRVRVPTEGGTCRKQTTSGVNLHTVGMTDLLLFRMWAFLRLKDTVVKTILDDAAALEHPTQRVRDNLLLPMSTLATWMIFGVSDLLVIPWPMQGCLPRVCFRHAETSHTVCLEMMKAWQSCMTIVRVVGCDVCAASGL